MNGRLAEAARTWRRRAAPWIDRIAAIERLTLIVLACVAGALWSFIELAEGVVEGESHFLDERLLLALRNPLDRGDPLGPGWVEELGRDVTALGSMVVLASVVLAAGGYLLLQRQRRAALLVFAATGGGVLLSALLKTAFDRPRPDLVPHGLVLQTTSFPSQHSMMAAVVYLTLGALLARVQPDPRFRAYLISWAVLITVAVGISRVYLGVHWPSDVLAGWCVGAAWALLWWLAMLRLQREGEVEGRR